MFIRKLELKNFKRFTDLTIDLSGENTPPKLVLMIGANGSGKSSVFDVFEWLTYKDIRAADQNHKLFDQENELTYQSKNALPIEANILLSNGKSRSRKVQHFFPLKILPGAVTPFMDEVPCVQYRS